MYKRGGYALIRQKRSTPSLSPSPSPSTSEFAAAQSSSVAPSVQQSNNVGDICIEDTRNFISTCGDSFTDSVYVVRILNKVVNNHWGAESLTYTSTPNETKELWWKEFKRRFTWNESDDNEIR